MESSPSLSQFLRFVVEETLAGRGPMLKEYSLGAEVFGRGEAFDPRLDPIVRVQARNLRARMAEYYAGPGANDPVIIELPKRTYVPTFHVKGEAEESASDVPAVEVEQASAAVAHASGGVSLFRNRFAPVIAVLVLATVTAAVWQFGFRPRPEPEPDAVAQDLYIHARQLMDQHTEASLRSSIETLGRAVERAPRYSLAWAGLAEAHNILAQYGYIEPAEGMKEARKAAQKSLEINPDLAEGHVALAAVIEAYDWNWAGAEREYRRAIQLNPELAAAHLWYGMFLRDQNRLKEALPELRHAAQLDPHSAITNLNLAYGLLMDGNSEGAVEAARHACSTAPGMVTAYAILASALRSSGQPEEGKKVLAEALERSNDDAHGLSILARASVRLGDKDQAKTMYDRMTQLSSQRYVSPYDLGTVSLALGEQDRAVKQFEEALKQRSSGIIFLRDANFAKSDLTPQFRSLIERLKSLG